MFFVISSIEPNIGVTLMHLQSAKVIGSVYNSSIVDQKMSLPCMTYASNILVLSKEIRV